MWYFHEHLVKVRKNEFNGEKNKVYFDAIKMIQHVL